MGQYYKAVVLPISNDGDYSPMVLDPRDHGGNAYKLLEHSYFGNYFVDSVMTTLERIGKGMVFWCGDYAGDDSASGFGQMCKDVWGKKYVPTIENNPTRYEGLSIYLVNYTKQEFIDLNNCLVQNDNSGWAIHPLPLLTAMSNGLGGGDYYGMNKEQCGSFVGDIIGIERDKAHLKEFADITDLMNFKE